MSDNNEANGQQFDADVIMQSSREVKHCVAYLRIYHYLSSFQAVKPLETTLNGAIIMPRSVMGSLGFGFTKDGKTFCLHTTGFLFDLFGELKPTVANIEHGGLTLRFSELKYADYILPPILVHFPIINQRVYELAKECLFAVITKIEDSLIEVDVYDVVEVLNPPIILEDMKSSGANASNNLSRIF